MRELRLSTEHTTPYAKHFRAPDTINKKYVNNKLMTITSINNNHIEQANDYKD